MKVVCVGYSATHNCTIYYLPALYFGLLILLFVVPTTPTYLNVCAVYDTVNETLQIIESSWNEVVC